MQSTWEAERRARREEIRAELRSMAEPEYAAFNKKLLRKPGEEAISGSAARMMGVRLPALRRLGKRLAGQDWRLNLEALAEGNRTGLGSYEEIMLQGILIGAVKPGALALEERLALVRDFLALIDNWAVCDSFCAGLRIAAEAPEETWAFLQERLEAEAEYEVRFALVMLLNNYVTEAYLERLFPIFDGVRHEGYYVKMAVAWAVSICYVNFPERTERYLEENALDEFTYGKALAKIIESRCVSQEDRMRLRRMRKRAAASPKANRRAGNAKRAESD